MEKYKKLLRYTTPPLVVALSDTSNRLLTSKAAQVSEITLFYFSCLAEFQQIRICGNSFQKSFFTICAC